MSPGIEPNLIHVAGRPLTDEREPEMRHIDNLERARSWVVDYSAARARAIEWLGDRYLLARPVNRLADASHHTSFARRPAATTER